MKKCNNCDNTENDSAVFCSACGKQDFSPLETAVPDENIPLENLDFAQVRDDVPATLINGVATDVSVSTDIKNNGNILSGAVGAFLFSLIGAALYFVLYQVNIIAGLSGLVIFVLANFGYGIFSGTKNKTSVAGLVVSIVTTVVMIFLSEYLCLSYEIFKAYSDGYGITFFDAIRITPEFLKESDVLSAVLTDLAFSYLFAFLATIGNIINIVKTVSNSKKAANSTQN